jgi:hypothetical protein
MTYAKLETLLQDAGYDRVERDDRLLDVFPSEMLEKGVELWEKWEENDVFIVRVRLPFTMKNLQLYSVPRLALEILLYADTQSTLSNYSLRSSGTSVLRELAGGIID